MGFSFASVILSYFLVGGGMFTGTLLVAMLGVRSEAAGYALLGAGAALGGFVASRASRGSTILEPAIGAIAVVGSIVGIVATTDAGRLVWAMAQDQTVRAVAAIAGAGAGGALAGAFVSEKLLGESTRSSVPWVLYAALSAFGACVLATLFASIVVFTDPGRDPGDELAKGMLLGMAIGCLLSGLAVGASARTRPLLAAFVGGGAGVAGFLALVLRASPESSRSGDEVAGIAVLAGGGCLVALIGTLAGWAAVGRRHAG